MRGLADALDKEIVYVETLADKENEHNVQWVLVTNNEFFLNDARIKIYASAWPMPNVGEKSRIIWTDDHSDLLSVLK